MTQLKSLFPVVKRFSDAVKKHSTVLLNEELTIHNKTLRKGSIIYIVGWREINELTFLVISKGTWEAIVPFSQLEGKIEECN